MDGLLRNALHAATVAFLVAATLILILRPIAGAVQLIDLPGGRKTHNGTIPIVGGLAIFGGFLLASAFSGVLGYTAAVILGAAGFMTLIGLLDDRFEISSNVRLFAQVVAAVTLVYGTKLVVTDLGDLLGFGAMHLGWAAWPFTIVALIALVNAFNMLDGFDGLAGGVAFSASVALAVLALSSQFSATGTLALALAGATMAFLLFNMPTRFNRRLRIFMGDSGSTLLGFTLAALALVLVQTSGPNIPPAVILWILPIPIFELFATTSRRLLAGRPPTHADDNHFHHRLAASGFSVRLIFVMYVLVSGFSASFGILAHQVGISDTIMFVAFAVFFVAWLAFIRFAPRLGQLLPGSWRRDGEIAIH